MKALCWMGKHEIGLRNVKEPTILNPHADMQAVRLNICVFLSLIQIQF